MKYQTAVNKLKKLAAGKHCAITYQQSFLTAGKNTQECNVYIDGGSWYAEATWALLLKALEKGAALNTANDAEAPENDDESEM